MPESSQFLKAIIAGAERASDIAKLRSQENLAANQQPEKSRGGGMPRFAGGGHSPQSAPAIPTGPYIGGIPGSPMLVDPARENKPDPVSLPFSLPGDSSGNKFVTSPSGEVASYVAPTVKPVYHEVENQLLKTDPVTGKTESVYTAPFRPPSDRPQSELDRLLNPRPANPTIPASTTQPTPQPNGTRVKNKVTGLTATWVNGQLVPDEPEPNTPIAEENIYDGMPGQQPGGGFSYFGPEVIPAR